MNKKSLNSFLKESFCTLCKNMKYKKSSIVVNDILFKTTNLFILCFLFITCFISCQDEQLILESPVSTRSIPTPTFDWENADWMPTPSGQSRIPSPWVGQGSIASIYGMDVINDRKSSDGWVLLYNTFETKAPGPLVNPYFILYNKYRGIMRIFLYTTTQFISPSTYLQDGISIISNHKSSLLNFMGEAIVDGSKNKETYSQMQPAPDDGSLPLASNKWYMMQYELAYDEQIAQLPYNSIQLNWYMNYYNVEKIDLNGDFVGTIKSAIGSSSGNNIFSGLGNVGKVTGTGILGGIGEYKGKTLSWLFENHRELFGNIEGDQFPLLVKIIDAKNDLSVQVHPDDVYAKEHENSLGKTECWFVLQADEGTKMVMGHHAKTKDEFVKAIENDDYDNLLNSFKIKAGDFFYIPSGTLHAICSGSLIYEAQQSSDITYRVYDYHRKDAQGNERQLHVQQSIDVATVPYVPLAADSMVETAIENGTRTKLVSSEFFTVNKYEMTGKNTIVNDKPFQLVTVIKGNGVINGNSVKMGDNFVVCADQDAVEYDGTMTVMICTL